MRLPGRLPQQIHVHYERNKIAGWVPTSWTQTQHSEEGSNLVTTNIQVLEMRLNQSIPPEEFDLRFPAGTHVSDSSNQKSYRVQEDGTMQEVSATGENLPAAEQGNPWHRRNEWLLMTVCIAMLIVASVYIVRKKTRKS